MNRTTPFFGAEQSHHPLTRSEARVALVVSRERVNHVGRTLRRLNHEEAELARHFDRLSAAQEVDGMTVISRALDVIRERRRVLLMVPKPANRREDPRQVVEVRPAEVVDVVGPEA